MSLFLSLSTEGRHSLAEHKPASVKVPYETLAATITTGVSPVTANTISVVPLDYGSIAANQHGCQMLPIQIDSVSFSCDQSTGSP
jgi:hypothetical protein